MVWCLLCDQEVHGLNPRPCDQEVQGLNLRPSDQDVQGLNPRPHDQKVHGLNPRPRDQEGRFGTPGQRPTQIFNKNWVQFANSPSIWHMGRYLDVCLSFR